MVKSSGIDFFFQILLSLKGLVGFEKILMKLYVKNVNCKVQEVTQIIFRDIVRVL